MLCVELPYEIVACVLVGGTEKLRGGEDYGVPLAASLEDGDRRRTRPTSCSTSRTSPCSGRPRASRSRRVRSRSGVPYEGADFRLDPPRFEPIGTPSLAVIGTGKRVGKTAVTGHVAAAPRPRPARRRRGDGARRAGRARGRRESARRSTTCSRSPAPGATPRPTTSRRRRSPACRRSAAVAAAAGSRARSGSRTCSPASGSRRSSGPT